MAPRSCQSTSSRSPLLDEDILETEAASREEEVSEGKDTPISTVTRLALNMDLGGNESFCNFEHLYTQPNLQTLGMPLNLVSLTSVVAGPTATLLIPLIGWISDRGANPHTRKAAAVLGTATIRVAGIATVILANVFMMTTHTGSAPTTTDHPVGFDSVNFTTTSRDWDVKGTAQENTTTVVDLASTGSGVDDIGVSELAAAGSQPDVIPLVAWLSMLGFVLIDIGVDSNSAAVKIYAVASAQRSQQTSVLVTGVFVAALGGMVTAATGMIDLGSLVGPADEAVKAAAKVSIHGVIILLVALLTSFVTIVTGKRLVKGKKTSEPDENKGSSEFRAPDEESGRKRNQSFLEASTRSILLSSRSSGLGCEASALLIEDNKKMGSERMPLLAEIRSLTLNEDDFPRAVVSGGNSSSTPDVPSDRFQLLDFGTTYDAGRYDQQKEGSLMKPGGSQHRACCLRSGYKTKIAMLCLSTFFGVAQLLVYSMTISDFVGKGIMKGDPLAAPDSESLALYQDGVRLASTGFLVYYGFYLISSVANVKLLKKLGYKCEYVAATMVMSACLLLLKFTERMEVFFLLSACAGIQRQCLLVIPFAVANDLTQTQVGCEKQGGSKQVGRVMSLVGAMMPLSYCAVYSWLGPLEDTTGDVGVNLLVATVSGVLTSLIFVLIRVS